MAVLFVDFETRLIDYAATGGKAPRPVCVAFARDGGPVKVLAGQDMRGWMDAALTALIKDETTLVAAHYAAFDLSVWAEATGRWYDVWTLYKRHRVRCTKVRESLALIAAGEAEGKTTLEATAARRLGLSVEGKHGPDAWRYRYGELEDVPLETWPTEAREYPVQDVDVLRRVFLAQEDLSLVDELPQVRADWCLLLATMRGLLVDGAAVRELRLRLEGEQAEAEDAMIRTGIRAQEYYARPNKNKGIRAGDPKGPPHEDKKVLQALVKKACDAAGVLYPLTTSGLVCTDRETVEWAAGVLDHEGLRAKAAAGRAEKFLSTYLPVLEGVTSEPQEQGTPQESLFHPVSPLAPTGQTCGPVTIHPNYRVLVASGRTSSYGPNVQNWPREGGLRECIIPRPGCSFIQADYGQLELITLAHVLDTVILGDGSRSSLSRAINSGQDLHVLMASRILGIEYAEAARRKRAKDPELLKVRQMSKAANYGFPGGMGAESFTTFAKGYGIVLDPEQAVQLRAVWFETWPEMRQYFDHINRIVGQDTGTVVQAVSRRVRGRVPYTAACNSLFQGLAADGAKWAIWRASQEAWTRNGPLSGFRLVAFVHDELIMEGPTGQAVEASRRLSTIMTESMQDYCPGLLVTAEPAVLDRWHK